MSIGNNVSFIGNLTKDPEVTTTQSGAEVLRFSLGRRRGVKKDGGEPESDFPSFVAFNKTAELIAKYFKKGDRIGISGRLQTGKYDKDGVTHYTTDVIVDNIEFLSSKKDSTSNTTNTNTENENPIDITNDSDLPF